MVGDGVMEYSFGRIDNVGEFGEESSAAMEEEVAVEAVAELVN